MSENTHPCRHTRAIVFLHQLKNNNTLFREPNLALLSLTVLKDK